MLICCGCLHSNVAAMGCNDVWYLGYIEGVEWEGLCFGESHHLEVHRPGGRVLLTWNRDVLNFLNDDCHVGIQMILW